MTTLMKLALALWFAVFCSAEPANADSHREVREGGLTGTGIVGEITRLGSIIVNDQRITFAPDLFVASALGGKTAKALLPGEVVAVAVTPDAEDWRAEAISQVHPAVGPISSVKGSSLTVLEARIEARESATHLAPGDWIAVSGFWQDQQIIATRIELIEPRETASLQGSYVAPQDGQGLIIGGVHLGDAQITHAAEGDVLRAIGVPRDGQLQVSDIQLGLFDRPVSVVLAEGYFSDVAPSGHYTVKGSGLSSFTHDAHAVMPRERIRICGVSGKLLHTADTIASPDLARLRELGCLPR